MIYKRLINEIAQRKLIISIAEFLHFDISTKSGSKCLGGSYKLLRGYPPSPLKNMEPVPYTVEFPSGPNPTLSA